MSLLGQQRRIAHVQEFMSASPLIPVELMTVGDGRKRAGKRPEQVQAKLQLFDHFARFRKERWRHR